MNVASAELLQQAIQNTGSIFGRQRQMDVENAMRQSQIDRQKKLDDIEQIYRDKQLAEVTRRADAEEARLKAAAAPKIQADLTDPETGSSMTFTGTPEQLDGLTAAAAAKGKRIAISNKKAFAAQFNIGESQFSFSDPDAAKKFADDFKAQHGIDVYAKVEKPGMQTRVGHDTELLTELKAAVDNAPNETERAAAQYRLDTAMKLSGLNKTTDATKPDEGAMTALKVLQSEWAKAVSENDTEKADRISNSIEATRKKWNINPPTAQQPEATAEKVRVINPKGQVGRIPKSQLSEALQQGYKLAN